MNIKSFLTATALIGALTTAGVAQADHETRRPVSSYKTSSDLDVIGTARLSARRGTVTFRITPEMRRDGLQLLSQARGLRILAVELIYSDDFVEKLNTREIGVLKRNALLTIQRGRPAGLREVKVRYSTTRGDRRARLHLVQIHDGNGYTSDRDIARSKRLRRNADRD